VKVRGAESRVSSHGRDQQNRSQAVTVPRPSRHHVAVAFRSVPRALGASVPCGFPRLCRGINRTENQHAASARTHGGGHANQKPPKEIIGPVSPGLHHRCRGRPGVIYPTCMTKSLQSTIHRRKGSDADAAFAAEREGGDGPIDFSSSDGFSSCRREYLHSWPPFAYSSSVSRNRPILSESVSNPNVRTGA